jgi:hypothetical protein
MIAWRMRTLTMHSFPSGFGSVCPTRSEPRQILMSPAPSMPQTVLTLPKRLGCSDDAMPLPSVRCTVFLKRRDVLALRCQCVVTSAERRRLIDFRVCWPRDGEPLVTSWSFRQFAKILAGRLPCLFYHFDPRGRALALLTLSLLPNLRVMARAEDPTCQIAFPTSELDDFFVQQVQLMKQIMRERGESRQRQWRRVVELREYFGLYADARAN